MPVSLYPLPEPFRYTSTVPPASVELAGGAYCNSIEAPPGTGASLLKIACIGEPGEQLSVTCEPDPPSPATSDHP